MEESKELQDFDEFWIAFPRKRDKIAARRMYKRALKLTTASEILRAAKLYAEERRGKEDRFTQYPATWLNAGGWDNYPQQQETAAPAGVYVKFTDPARDAWDAYGKQTRGKTYPQDRAGGWWFPSRWPPDHEGRAT